MRLSLNAARINAGYTQKNAAKHLKISEDCLYNYESGRSYPNVLTIKKMLSLYHVEFSDIIFPQ